MHKNLIFTNIIGMEVFDLKVICYFGAFKQFMLYLLYNNILSIKHDKNIACTKVNRTCPAFRRRIEWVIRSTSDFFTVHSNMYPFFSLISEQLNNFFECGFTGFFIGCPYQVARLYIFNRYKTILCCHKCSRYEALNPTEFLTNELHTASHYTACNTYLKCILKGGGSTVSNFFGCSICSRADCSLDNTCQSRSHARASRGDCAAYCTASSRNANSLPVDLFTTNSLRNNTGNCATNCTNYSTDGNMPEFTAVIGTCNGVIIAVSKQILIGKAHRRCRQHTACICVQESTPVLVVITATEIVHTEIGIIIVSTVTEGVVGVSYEPIGGGCTAYQRNSSFTPSIVVIGSDLGSALVIDRNDIALKILLKQIVIEYSGSKGTCAVSNTYRSLFWHPKKIILL